MVQGEKGELSKRFIRVYEDERGDEYRARNRESTEESSADGISGEVEKKDGVEVRMTSVV